MRPVYEEMIDTCTICGNVACERDLYEIEYDEELSDCRAGDLVCRSCAS